MGAELFTSSMKEKLAKKPEIFTAILPHWAPACRRISPGPGYLEALVEDNVRLRLYGSEIRLIISRPRSSASLPMVSRLSTVRSVKSTLLSVQRALTRQMRLDGPRQAAMASISARR
jgi:hypothetical protein